jgi:argininosuccinate lyase
LVSYALEKGRALSQLSLSEYQRFSPLFGDDVYSVTVASSIAARNIIGGTAPEQVARALARAKGIVSNL